MANVSLQKVTKEYPNGFVAVKAIDLEIEDKEFMVLVGPSGCGKTTTLRMIAGLEEITEGELYVGGERMTQTDPRDRDMAMVFQSYALYPHMDVYRNMSFGLRIQKLKKDEIEKRVKKAADILDIDHLLDRKPKQLSGGQRQRVALGRAIVRDPKVFLMDEPLSNLDAKLRVQMRAEIIKLHKDLQTTFIYVTHDQTEAMTMGSRICVMKDGLIQQVDTPKEIYNRPVNAFVAGFIGSPQMNFITGRVEETDALHFVFQDGERQFRLPLNPDPATKKALSAYAGKDVLAGIRPEHAQLAEKEHAHFEETVLVSEMLGSETYIHYHLQGKIHTLKSPPDTDIAIGDTIPIRIDPARIHFFDKETEKRIG